MNRNVERNYWCYNFFIVMLLIDITLFVNYSYYKKIEKMNTHNIGKKFLIVNFIED